MRIILTSHGSTGDIYPLIALGRAIRSAGHEVVFATIPHWQGEICEAGLEFYSVCPNWAESDLTYWMGRLLKLRSPVGQLREIYRGALPFIPEMIARMDALLPGADLLVSSYLFPMNRSIADRHGVPFATFCFAPHAVPSPDYPPEGVPALRWLPLGLQRRWNARMWKTANGVVDRVINQVAGSALAKAGLPRVRQFFSAPADCVVVAVSKTLIQPQAQIHPRFQFTGYCRWQAPEDPSLETKITDFTEGVPVPVITFGSMVYDDPAEWMRRFVNAWPIGKKVVVQRGWARFPSPSDAPHVLLVDKVSHDQLFEHASVVVHHGGAGTTASALHSGKPQVVVPHIGDQHFFGSDVERLGCGVKLRRKYWPEELHAAIQRVLREPGIARRAREMQAALVAEDGPSRAVEVLEAFAASAKKARHEAGRS